MNSSNTVNSIVHVFVLVPIIEQVPICIIHQATLYNAAQDSLNLTLMLQQSYTILKLLH